MLRTHIGTSPITWNGHLCEGDQLVPGHEDTFCLWTRCGQADVPAGKAAIRSPEPIRCAECQEIAAREGQFGVGA